MAKYGFYPHRMAFLRSAKSRESFLRHFERFFTKNSDEYALIARAHDMTEKLFVDEYRFSGELYIMHPRRVALIALERANVHDVYTIVACILHDNREFDEKHEIGTWTSEFVEKNFNYYVEVLTAAVTAPRVHNGRSSAESHRIYHERFRLLRSQRNLFEVKLPDRHDNLLTLSCDIMPQKQVIAKVRETRTHYQRASKRHGILEAEMEKVLTWHEKKLGILYP